MKINPDNVYKRINPVFMKVFKHSLSEKTFRQFLKHYLVGSLGVIINYTLFNILVYSGLDIKPANLITYTVLFIIIFILQMSFTYKPGFFSMRQPALFLLNTLIYGLADTQLLLIMIKGLHITPLISKFISIVCLTPMSFLVQKFIIFRERKAA